MITFIISVVLFLFLVLCPSSTVNAQAMPSISNSSFQAINGGQDMLINGYGAQYGIWGMLPSDLRQSIQDFLGYDPRLTAQDFHVRPLTEIEKENLETGFVKHFYDQNGNEIPLDQLYYVSGSNGCFSSEFYIDSAGNMLFADANQSNRLFNLSLMPDEFGSGSLSDTWPELMNHISNEIKENNFNFSPSGEDVSNLGYFLWAGRTYAGVPSAASYMLIPNQYNPGNIVPVNTENSTYINSWYCNSLDLFTYKDVLGHNNWLQVTPGNFSKDGHNYSYVVTFAQGMYFRDLPISSTYEDWVSSSNTYDGLFGKQGVTFNTSYDVFSRRFFSVLPEEIPNINLNELYSYDELQNLQPETDPLENPNYDPYNPLSPDNWPQSFPMPDGLINPSDLPLPGSNNNINPSPFPGDTPIVDIDPSSPLPFDVPIIRDLQYRFPFSIPWDLWRMLRHTVFEPVPPAWDFDYSITVLGHTYTTHFQGDLSAFNSLAEIFRTLLLVSFVLFLAFISYKFFF